MGTRQGCHCARRRAAAQLAHAYSALAEAAADRRPVAGWTHSFYRYPARFSPRFAAAAIASFSRPGDLVLDPYMGGGTTAVEGVISGRHVVGNDLNSLAAFVAKVKVTPLTTAEASMIERWATNRIPRLTYRASRRQLARFMDPKKTRNMSLVRARFIKKSVAGALGSISDLPSPAARDFARCVVLRVTQWALDGRKCHTPLSDFRCKLGATALDMLQSLRAFARGAKEADGRATVVCGDAADLAYLDVFNGGRKASLVVTSPPYPGVHVLYHRWQVDGRKETPAPYWIAGCEDGNGASFYNFGDRHEAGTETYFRACLKTMKAIRGVVNDGAFMVQVVAFNRPDDQLPRYLDTMRTAGFREVCISGVERIWRQVPQRKWHASLKGKTHSANEVVLIHRAD